MQSALSAHQSVNFCNQIQKLLLGVNYIDKVIVINAYLNKQVIEEVLRKLIVSFTYQGEEITFRVKDLQRGIPIRLILEPENHCDLVREFIQDKASTCLVPTVTFVEGSEIITIKNAYYNDKCFP